MKSHLRFCFTFHYGYISLHYDSAAVLYECAPFLKIP